jgi:hypothetical protein
VLAAHLVDKGFTYDDLGEAQSVLLDEFGCGIWGRTEGLADALDAKQLSPEWLHPNEVWELLFRAGHLRFWQRPRNVKRPSFLPRTPVRLLRLLRTGRRFGTEAERTWANAQYYVVLSPAELVELRQEVLAAIDAPIAWENPKFQPEATERNLLVPLTETIGASSWGAMKYAF